MTSRRRAPAAKRPVRGARSNDRDDRDDTDRDREPIDREPANGEPIDSDPADEAAVDDDAPPPPAADFRVHIYEHRQFKRTIDRPFTAEDAEAFASEFNRTSKSYGRFALAGKEDAKPRKMLDG